MYTNLFERNLGFISNEEQLKLTNTSIGIAGAGGDGGLLAERLARFGVGKILLADPENFEVDNCNRQFAANIKCIGRNKAEIVAEELKLINPGIEVKVYNQGISTENIQEFVSSSDVIVDEIEYSIPELSVLLAQEARKQNKHVFMGANIGWGASIFCFSPTGMTFEEFFEYDPSTKQINPLKYMKEIPEYLDKQLLTEVLSGERPMPSISSSVALVAALLSSQIILFLIDKKKPKSVPEFMFFETYNLM